MFEEGETRLILKVSVLLELPKTHPFNIGGGRRTMMLRNDISAATV
jgi:hypothetical protein